MCSYSRYSAINIVAVLCCNYPVSTLTQAYSPVSYIAWIKTLSLTWFPLLFLSLLVLVHILSQVFLCGVICFYHSASAAVPCHNYFAWLSLLARSVGDRPLGSTRLGANRGLCAPVREWGGLREDRGGKSIFLKQGDFPVLWKDL